MCTLKQRHVSKNCARFVHLLKGPPRNNICPQSNEERRVESSLFLIVNQLLKPQCQSPPHFHLLWSQRHSYGLFTKIL